MFEISENFLVSNPLIAVLLLLFCGLLWKLLGIAFDKITKSKEKERDEFIDRLKELSQLQDKEYGALVKQLREITHQLTEISCDLRVATEAIAHHDKTIERLEKDVGANKHLIDSVAKTVTTHSVKIEYLEKLHK